MGENITPEMQHYINLRMKSREGKATNAETEEMRRLRYTFTDKESHQIREVLGTNGLIVGGERG